VSADIAFLDFETYSELELKGPKGVGSCRYAEHPSTEILCAAYAIGDEPVQLWVPGNRPPQRLFDHVAACGQVHAWNVEMEIPVWHEIAVPELGWPIIPFVQWRDTQAVAAMYALPLKLGECGAALGLEIQKDKRGEHLIHKLCKPRRPSKNNPATRWTPRNAPVDFYDFYQYCIQDVEAERAIHHALPTQRLPHYELEIWRSTVGMNLRGWPVDATTIERVLKLLDEHGVRALGELRDLTAGEVTTGKQVEKIKDWLRARDVDLPDLTKETVVLALADPLLSKECRRMLELRQILSKASTSKYQKILTMLCDDGTVKNLLQYHGALTGRDAGRGIQIQNFPRAAVSKTAEGVEEVVETVNRRGLDDLEHQYGSFTATASKLLRSVLTSRPGHDLVAADFSSIENRMTVWYADCKYGIDLFEKGLDEYRLFAQKFHHFRTGEEIGYDEVTTEARQRAKPSVLGCCFGLGKIGLVNQAANYGEVFSEEFAESVVNYYRGLYREVPETWYDLDAAARYTVETGEPMSVRRLAFEVEDDFLYMILASGRRIAYYKPKVEMQKTPWGALKPTVTHMGRDSKTSQWVRMKIIPGRYLENAVQATARDIMMHGARNVEAAGYIPVGRVHDEVISEVPEGQGHLDDYIARMVDVPRWVKGIPITAEGWRGKRFRK
jgi:DNA polymerase